MKLHRDSYSGDDLIKIAAFLDCELAFIVDNTTKIALVTGDIKTPGVAGTGEEI